MADDLGSSVTHPYTCLSCSLAFSDTAAQREHYATDLHRYNSKRRVAGLGPVTAQLFNEKVLERKPDAAEETAAARLSCKTCNKTFNTAATQSTHMLSKKHKEAVFRAASGIKVSDLTDSPSPPATPSAAIDDEETPTTMDEALDAAVTATASTSSAPSNSSTTVLPVVDPSGDDKLDQLVARRIIAAPPISPTTCLFCPTSSSSPKENVAHMRLAHSFVIPEEEYLVDLEGLLRRLGEEVGTWNVCVCCGKGYGGNINLDSEGQSEEEMRKRASKGVEAVRNHMKMKSHCKLPYNTESQRLDLADFYDFRPSYPDYVARKERKALKKGIESSVSTEEWEEIEGDIDMDEECLEVVYESASESDSDDSEDSDDEALPSSEITYGDSTYELVLPSGARIGHRAHSHIHRQNLAPYLGKNPFTPSAHSSPHTAYKPSPHSQALLSLIPSGTKSGKMHARPLHEQGLIPARGAGHGGRGDVIKARNKGEAKNAMKTVRNFKELQVYNKQAFIRGVKNNSQEHYRDHLLQ